MEESNLLPKEILNTRGQVVGYFNNDDKSYHTKRDKLKGQLFIKKIIFNGVEKPNAIAIDREILKKLMIASCRLIYILILNDREMPYTITITPKEILAKGVRINYDKVNSDGLDTGFGEQYVFSITEDCRKLDTKQETL